MLKGAEPLGQMISWLGAPGTTKYSFEKVDMPDGYVVLGDAIASLNPRFATGMTVVAKQVCPPAVRGWQCRSSRRWLPFSKGGRGDGNKERGTCSGKRM